ncbi:MAG: CPBP family intramembrane metalloprotease [Planctomycetia bacterium]|nr:CPBP family intramembrane metalloprotease [Planctomycetia bacterium]
MTDIPSNIPPKDLATTPADGYWRQSRRPLVSLVFITPLLVVYEIGILALGTDAMRNGVDVWLRTLLEWIGFGQYFLLPVLTVCILLGWQYASRERWRVSAGVLYGMAVECVLLAIFLRVILQLQSVLLEITPAGAGLSLSGMLDGPVMFLGAGIYEELLFRLILLTATIGAMRYCGMKRGLAVVAAVLTTSLLFSVAHYVGPYGEAFKMFGFLFRFVAGIFFCVLFVNRGFGIAAGTHAGYDILVGLWP